jgi:hypothetical protein
MSSCTPAASAASATLCVTQSGFRGRACAGWLETGTRHLAGRHGPPRGLDLSQVARDQRTGDRIDGKPAVLVGLGVLTNAADTGDHHEPQVQAQVSAAHEGPAITLATSSGEVARIVHPELNANRLPRTHSLAGMMLARRAPAPPPELGTGPGQLPAEAAADPRRSAGRRRREDPVDLSQVGGGRYPL